MPAKGPPVLLILLLLSNILPSSSAFNLEPKHSLIIDDRDQANGSYFGFALGVWKNRPTKNGPLTPWLLVGAPKSDAWPVRVAQILTKSSLLNQKAQNPGALYNCSLHDGENNRCTLKSYLPRTNDEVTDDVTTERLHEVFFNNSWIGGSIAVEDKVNGAIAVCAPMTKYYSINTILTIPGVCWHEFGSKTTTLKRINRVSRLLDAEIPLTYSQLGMSAAFDMKSNLVVGAPGVNSTGGLGIYTDLKGNPRLDLSFVKQQNLKDSYIGYSATTGQFDGRYSYIVGAPRGNGEHNLTGVVYVIQKDNQGMYSDLKWILSGTQMGEYFGASLAVLKGKDAPDWLVVGAPWHSPRPDKRDHHLDSGLVYLFQEDGQGMKLKKNISGSFVAGARFGYTLASIGDLNNDGYSDLAVGAPYERNDDDEMQVSFGAVYIFHGEAEGLRSKYSQRIRASDVDRKPPAGLKGFGISIASGLDIDDNHFDDLIVGSHESGSVSIIKSYPVIKILARIEPSIREFIIGNKNFTVETCFRYTTVDSLDLSSVEIEVKLKVDHFMRRAFIQQGKMSNLTVTYPMKISRHDNCSTYNITVKDLKVARHPDKPINLTLEYKLLNNTKGNKKGKKFCSLCPVLDPIEDRFVQESVSIAQNKPFLKLEYSVLDNKQIVFFGEDKNLRLNVTISNIGKVPAYFPKLVVTTSPAEIGVNVTNNVTTRRDGPSTVCYPTVLLPGDSNKEELIRLELNLTNLPDDAPKIDVELEASSGQTTVKKKIEFEVMRDARLIVVGKAKDKEIKIQLDEKNERFSLVHEYEITNDGLNTVGVEFHLNVPHSFNYSAHSKNDFPQISYANVKIGSKKSFCKIAANPFSEPSGGPRVSRSVMGYENAASKNTWSLNCPGFKGVFCVEVYCENLILEPRSSAKVMLNVTFNTSITTNFLRTNLNSSINFKTDGYLYILNRDKYILHPSTITEATAETEIKEQLPSKFNWYIVIFSAVLGLLLIAVIVFGFTKAGFFERPVLERLESMRKQSDEESLTYEENVELELGESTTNLT